MGGGGKAHGEGSVGGKRTDRKERPSSGGNKDSRGQDISEARATCLSLLIASEVTAALT